MTKTFRGKKLFIATNLTIMQSTHAQAVVMEFRDQKGQLVSIALSGPGFVHMEAATARHLRQHPEILAWRASQVTEIVN